MNGPLTGWRVLLRIAWRDVLRNKGRSALILVMIALPVLGVTAAHVVISTADVTTEESLDRNLGRADALVDLYGGGKVVQGADPNDGGGTTGGRLKQRTTEADLVAALGDGARLVERREDWLEAQFGDRVRPVRVISADLDDPIFEGTFELTAGRLPERPGEVIVNEALSDWGAVMGGELGLFQVDGALDVVGIAKDAQSRDQEVAWAWPGSVEVALADEDHSVHANYLVEVPGGVDWQQVRELNELGAMVTSRKVLADPPSRDQLPEEVLYDHGDDALVTTIALIIAMAVLEIVLLAGPSFAVGARRRQRQLAQLAASGGTPAQVRHAVVATAVVLGGIGAGLGLLGGIALGAATLPFAQRFEGSWFGPFDLVWSHLLGIALLGWLSAVIAALVPAWLASRQDVVKALAGRRGDSAPGKASPVLGLLIGGVGLAIAVAASTQYDMGENSVALSAILVVLGSVLLLPPVVALLGRVARGLPLPLRYALRDAARHRTRTVPAIGAVLATVAGVVALGIANASDQARSRATYEPATGMGDGFVSYHPDGLTPEAHAKGLPVVLQTARELEPDLVEVRSLGSRDGLGPEVELRQKGQRYQDSLLSTSRSHLGRWVVSNERPDIELWLDDDGEAAVDEALAAGKVVLFTDDRKRAAGIDQARLVPVRYTNDGRRSAHGKAVTAPAVVVEVQHGTTEGIVPAAVAKRLGVPAEFVSISLPGPLTEVDERAIEKALTAADVPEADVYVERGWQEDRSYLILIWVLAAVGGLLMIGGTLTATFLALSDAVPDLATLLAVGGAPRERRLVAASYALVVGGIGAVIGAVVGFVPGIAGARSLTRTGWLDEGTVYHYLDIPWLLILGVVVGLPLLTALVVGLCARSRLPLVARID